jgi:hypothetical protein
MDYLQIILPLIGVVVGATLQYFFSRSSENRKQQETLKVQSYIDYVKMVNTSLYGNPEEYTRIADVRARIAVYGSSKVIEKIKAFEKSGSATSSKEYRELLCEMRIEAGNKSGSLDGFKVEP